MDKKFKEWWDSLPGEQNDSLMVLAHCAYLLGKSTKKKEKAESDALYKPFVEAWCAAYPDLGFNAVTGRKIKDIIAHSRAIAKDRGHEGDEEKILGLFKYILNYVARENHFVHKKPITLFESNYRSIYTEIRSGKSTGKKLTAAEQLRAIHRG